MVAKDPHGWNTYSDYFDVHERVMRGFKDSGFVLDDGVRAIGLGYGNMSMEGTIECAGGIYVTVDKTLAIRDGDGRRMIRSTGYDYNAILRGVGGIVFYHGPHPHHNQFQHVHRFDVLKGDDEGTMEACPQPTLGQMLAELEEWYYDHRDELPQG